MTDDQYHIITSSLQDLYDQLIINIRNNNIDDSLHFDDVVGAILEEESGCKNKEERSKSSKKLSIGSDNDERQINGT